jgi:hypothetical protein
MNSALVTALFLAGGTVVRAPDCRIYPRVIEVGAFYEGAEVRVEGVAAPRSKVIVTITGSDREERYKKKARFGPIWLNASNVRISGAPSLFLRFSAEPVGTMLSGKQLAELELDEASVKKRIHIEPPAPDAATDARLRSDFLALKKTERIYRFAEAGIAIGGTGSKRGTRDDGTRYSLHFHWPKKAPPAEYKVRVLEVRDGAVVRDSAVPLSVVRTGFPGWVAHLAEASGSLYGLTALVIGVLAGFGIDFLTTHIFGKKRAAAH